MKRLGLLLAVLIPVACVGGLLYFNQPHDDARSPVPLDKLGLHKDYKAKGAKVAQSLPKFRIFGAAQDNAAKKSLLWDAVVRHRGSHLPNIPQQIGDCVSFGSANGENYLQYQQIDSGQASEFHAAFPPLNYGLSRVTIGRKHGSNFGHAGPDGKHDGSVLAYAAEGARDYGLLPSDDPQCPPYSGDLARSWGNDGPPQWALDVARKQKVRTIAQVTTADQARDALCNGYPVVISSDFGTRTIRPQDGRQVARHDASWGHCMCMIGYDGTGRQPYFYVLNSWGPDAHPAPLQGEPPGGFWIDLKTMMWILSTGDCWAFSAFDGFPSTLDVSPLRPHKVQLRRPRPVAPQSDRGSTAKRQTQTVGGSKA